MMNHRIFENLGALEKGVVIPSCNVNDELRKMEPCEARAAKRRWRKLKRRVRRAMKSKGLEEKDITKDAVKYHIRSILRNVGKEKLGL